MLKQVLGLDSPADLDAKVIEGLVAQRQEEHQRLDFKTAPPPRTSVERERFPKTVSGMANGGGGLIIYGVKETDDRASETRPFDLVGEAERLRNLVSTRVQPFLAVTIHEAFTNGTNGYLVLEVVPSSRRPYAAYVDGVFTYWMRSGRETNPMGEAEIERLYRSRFAGTEEIDASLAKLIEPLGDRTVWRYPLVYVAAVPAEFQERLFRPDNETLEEWRKGSRPRPVFGLDDRGQVLPTYVRIGFKRAEWHDTTISEAGDEVPVPRTVEIRDDGSFVGVVLASGTAGGIGKTARIPNQTGRVEKHEVFHPAGVVAGVLGRLVAYASLADEIGLIGDAAIAVGILASSDKPAIMLLDGEADEIDLRLGQRTPIETRIEVEVRSLAPGPPLISAAKPMLDDIFTALRWPGCHYLAEDGTIPGTAPFHRSLWPGVKAWAKEAGITVTEDG